MNSFNYGINHFKFSVADSEQVRKDFTRDSELIFINGKPLKNIYKDMNIIVEKEGDLQEEHLLIIWNKFCFTKTDEKQLPYWQKFANALFHQGGLLYGFESALKEKMSVPNNDSKAYIPEKIEKEIRISFNERNLTVQENCIFKKIKDSSGDEENDLIAKKGSYLLKAQLTHTISLFKENDELMFRHIMVQPEFECKNLELQKCLNQRRLSIIEAIKNFITVILIKLFQLEFKPNKACFFQKPCYQSEIYPSQIIMKKDSSNLLKNQYIKIS